MFSEDLIIEYARQQVSLLLEGKFDLVYNAMSIELKKEYTDVDHLIKNYESMLKHMGYVKETLQFAAEYGGIPNTTIEDINGLRATVVVYIEGKCYSFLNDQLVEDEDGYYLRSSDIDEEPESSGIEMKLDISSDEIKINELYIGML